MGPCEHVSLHANIKWTHLASISEERLIANEVHFHIIHNSATNVDFKILEEDICFEVVQRLVDDVKLILGS